MDPGHHTAFLLAILICILLLLLAVSAVLMCYWRRHGLQIGCKKPTMGLGGLMRDQATSMTSFTWNVTGPKCHHYNGIDESQAFSLPITVDRRGKDLTSNLFVDSHVLNISDNEEFSQTSDLVNRCVKKKSDRSGLYSGLQCVLSVFSLKSNRRSSSLKSGINSDIMMVPLESPVSSSAAGPYQASSLPRERSQSSTLLCENSSDQQFTWDTAGLSILSNHAAHVESFSIPNTIQRNSCVSEQDSKIRSTVHLQKPDLQPITWFVSLGNRPISDGVQLENRELNNVTSLDSGVDVLEVPGRTGGGNCNTLPKPASLGEIDTKDNTVFKQHSEEMKCGILGQAQEESKNLYISHQEAARKLNPGHNGRSLWEKREERPLIGVN